MSFLSSLFTSTEEQIQQEFDLGIQPLRSRKWAHFNWSHILLDISGPFHSTKCLPKETFREILQFNDMEMLIGQIFSLLYVAADRCKESVSPKAQLTLRNGLVLIYQMMKNYVNLLWEQYEKEDVNVDVKTGSRRRCDEDNDDDDNNSNNNNNNSVQKSNDNNNNGTALLMSTTIATSTMSTQIHLDPPHFQNDFYKNMLRILLMSGDERVFREDVIECSNFMLAFLLSDRIYGPLFLMYVNELRFQNSTLEALFFNSLDRLLCYQKRPELHICLPHVYSILWSLFSYSNFNNRIFLEMIPQRRNENKNLSNFLSLFLLHVKKYSMHNGGSNPSQNGKVSNFGVFIQNNDTEMLTRHEYSTCNYALQMLLIFTLNNPEFRCLFFDHVKSVPLFWDMLLSRVSQNLNKNAFFKTMEDQQWLKQSILIMRLLYVAVQSDLMRERLLSEFASEKQEKDLLESLFYSNSDKKEAIISGRLFSFIKWISVISTNNVTKKQIQVIESVETNNESSNTETNTTTRKEIMVFVDSDMTCLTLRMLLVIARKNREVLLNELMAIKDFSDFFMTTLIVNLRTISDMVTFMTPLCGKKTSEMMHGDSSKEFSNGETIVHMCQVFKQIANIVISILIELIMGNAPLALIESKTFHDGSNQSIASDMDSISDDISNLDSNRTTAGSSSIAASTTITTNNTITNPETIEKNKQLLSLHRSLMKYEKSIHLAREAFEPMCRFFAHRRESKATSGGDEVWDRHPPRQQHVQREELEEESDHVLLDNLIQLVAYAQYFKNRYGESDA
nr:unnamed protein product [Naegleria fowleri]